MNINNLTTKYINKRRTNSIVAETGKISSRPVDAWIQGWNAAIRFAIRVEQADYVCNQCGKLIIKAEDHNFDASFNPFCKKCYDKLFKEVKKDEKETSY